MSEHPVDDIMFPLGFELFKKARNTRRYQKMIDGRRVVIKYQRLTSSGGSGTGARYYVRSSLWLTVDSSVMTRARLSNKQNGGKPLGGKLKEVPASGDYEDRHIYALDPNWTQNLIHDHKAEDLILSLTSLTEGVAPPPALTIQPGNLVLMGSIPHEAMLTQAYVERRVDEMVQLAQIAESLSQTYTPVKQTRGDRSVVEGANPMQVVIGLVIIIAVLAIPSLICIGVALLMSQLQ